MLGAGEERARRAEVVGLETAHAGAGDGGAKEGILPGALGNAAPARVARDVDHRREGPVDAGGGRLDGGDALAALDGGEIPGGRRPERDGEDGPVTVDDIEPEEQRDVQPR